MASYLISGASRGLGFEFLRQLSQDPANTVIGLVRDTKSTQDKVRAELPDRSNIHIVRGDLSDYKSLEAAAAEVGKITDGKLDYLIANAAVIPKWSAYDDIATLGQSPDELEEDLLATFKTNVVSQIHLINLFMPLVLGGTAKKVVALSTGLADFEATRTWNLAAGAPYAISKAALVMAVAKFSARYAEQGVLFLSVTPGVVMTGQFDGATEEQMAKVQEEFKKFAAYAPDFKGPMSAEEAIKAVLTVVDSSSLEGGRGGAMLSHKGNKQWL
ncbi:hypothetical protein S7711_08637 [Stachybotrys chartarum IBT 7711]|uniref:Uncharacterized protein n=1 Tax=Stachybotrys chartarum (strain CBS 109288 / IBT 7711) TaxID=1280523 RepID=A0A084AXS8_STACB|nr:hypothetical protein S7711_08637 [Stachybotrys chartarum IBT 7711]